MGKYSDFTHQILFTSLDVYYFVGDVKKPFVAPQGDLWNPIVKLPEMKSLELLLAGLKTTSFKMKKKKKWEN